MKWLTKNHSQSFQMKRAFCYSCVSSVNKVTHDMKKMRFWFLFTFWSDGIYQVFSANLFGYFLLDKAYINLVTLEGVILHGLDFTFFRRNYPLYSKSRQSYWQRWMICKIENNHECKNVLSCQFSKLFVIRFWLKLIYQKYILEKLPDTTSDENIHELKMIHHEKQKHFH